MNIVFLHSMLWLLVTANVVPSSLIPVTLMMEVICSSETSVLTRTTWCNISEDGILHEVQTFMRKFKTAYIALEQNFEARKFSLHTMFQNNAAYDHVANMQCKCHIIKRY
jgi:hypothetical protein